MLTGLYTTKNVSIHNCMSVVEVVGNLGAKRCRMSTHACMKYKYARRCVGGHIIRIHPHDTRTAYV